MQYHEAALLFPADEENIPELADDIRKNGQHQPIELYRGKIIDGRRRWAACQMAGVDPITTEVDPPDPFAYAVSLNLHRRHLTTGQKAMVGDRIREHYDKEAKERQSIAGQERHVRHTDQLQENLPEAKKGQARDQVGKLVGVSGKNIDYARKVREQGAPELVQAVEEGRMAISTAAILASEPVEVQVVEATKPKRNRKYAGGTLGGAPPKPEAQKKSEETKPAGMHNMTELFAKNVAQVAITQLKSIPKNSKFRSTALEIVSGWITENGGN